MELIALSMEDLPDCHALLADSVAALPDEVYSLSQRLAWAGVWDEATRLQWASRLAQAWGVCLRQEGEMAGFAWLSHAGQFDMLYVAPWAQRHGLGMAMIDHLEALAAKAGVVTLHAWASQVARPLFEKAAYVMMRPNSTIRDGVELANWLMVKGDWQEHPAMEETA